MKINTIYNENCLDTMARMIDGFIDLTITSPPYDSLRTYNMDESLWSERVWKAVISELHRVTKQGGVVVWIVGDATVKGSETGTSFKQALWAIECGFNLHDTMIWNKGTFTAVGSLTTRYAPVYEFMFVFSKGRPSVFHPIRDRKNKSANVLVHGSIRQQDGTTKRISAHNKQTIPEYGQRFNIWKIPNVGNRLVEHPATFPEQLVCDHVISWSDDGDLVFDPFVGSGTTAKVAKRMSRRYIGAEINARYCEIAVKRLQEVESVA